MHAHRPSPEPPTGGRVATVSVPGNVLDGLARATLEATAAIVLVCDAGGRVMLANPALQRFTGRTREELVGALFYDVVVQPEEVELARAGVAHVLAGRPAIPGEVDWLAGDGERRRVELQTSVLARDDGAPCAVAFIGIDVTVHREREAHTHRLAMTDPLTGVANRSALFAVLGGHLDAATGGGCGLLFCDLDDFKAVNDRYGHAAGDRLLTGVAERLREVAGPEDVVARLGGDEFVVLFRGTDAGSLAERVRALEARMDEPFGIAGTLVRIGASIGSAIGRPGNDPDALMAEADLAMYGVKTVRRARRTPPTAPSRP
ncbi:diguanylate cyclase domain-containing protein [Geodermatophilus sp. SYSU D00703]